MRRPNYGEEQRTENRGKKAECRVQNAHNATVIIVYIKAASDTIARHNIAHYILYSIVPIVWRCATIWKMNRDFAVLGILPFRSFFIKCMRCAICGSTTNYQWRGSNSLFSMKLSTQVYTSIPHNIWIVLSKEKYLRRNVFKTLEVPGQ